MAVFFHNILPNRDTHLYSPHNISSVYLTTTTYVRRSGRITNGMRSGRTAPQDSAFSSLTPAPTPRNNPPRKSLGPAWPHPHRCRTFPLLPVQMGYGLLCSLWVWHRTNSQPCCPPLSNPSTPHGLQGLTVLDNETTKWLLNTCPDI